MRDEPYTAFVLTLVSFLRHACHTATVPPLRGSLIGKKYSWVPSLSMLLYRLYRQSQWATLINFHICVPTAFIPVEELESPSRYKVVLASNVVFNAKIFSMLVYYS